VEEVQRRARRAEAARPLGNLLARAGEAVEALRKNIDANPGDVDLGKRLDALTRRRDGIERRLKRLEDNAQAPTDGSTGYSSPSPVSDGENIWAMFGTGVAACYDMDGERRWIALLDRPNHGWGYSASPILADGKLIVSVTDVMALDAASGEEVWRVQSGYHFGTPLAIGIGGVGVLVTPEGQLVRLADGKVLASGMGGLPFNSPIVCDGVMYGVGYDDRKAKAWRLPAEADVAAAPELLWEVEVAPDRYYTSPVCYEGLLYAVTAGGVLNVINAEHGSEVYRRNLDLGGTYFASPTIAGGYLFLMNDGGTALVLEPGPRYVEVARSPLEAVRSTPVFAGNRTYLNYLGTLRCVQGGPVNPTDVWIGRFWASPSTAVAGQPVTLTWDTVNADAVRIEPGVGPVKGTGSATVSPAQTTTYTLTAEGPGGPLDARAVVTTLAVRNADVPAGLKPGLSVAYYELGETASLPDFTALRPYKKDRAARVEYAATGGDFATSGRADNVGAVFTGYVEAPRAGVYTFYTESDDGSALYLGGARIVDNDGLHGMLEKSGTIALGPGMHALRVEFFERGGGAGLVVRWEGPGIGKAVMPDAALQHAPEGG